MGALSEAHCQEDVPKARVPVAWTATEAIERLMEMPVGARFGNGATFGGTDNNNFRNRESGMTEGVFAVALFEDTAAFDGKGNEDAQRDLAEDGGICVGLGPIRDLKVAQHHHPRFGTNRMTKFIKLDGEYRHGGNDFAGEEGKLGSGDNCEGVLLNQGVVLFMV